MSVLPTRARPTSREAVPRFGHWLRRRKWLRLSRRERRTVAVLGTANLIDSYDIAIMGLALPQIQQGLGIEEQEVGTVGAVVRLGVLPAVFLTLLADTFGRRRLLLITILAFTLATFVTAFSRSAAEFATLQFLARTFIAAEGMLAVVVIAEEFRARHRGWGIGILSAMGTLGHGLAALVFSTIHYLPYGWRALYVLGVVPLLLIAWFRRSLRETRRFRSLREHSPAAWQEAARPVRRLLQLYPGRLVALCAALFPLAFVLDTSLIFVSKTLQEVHGYSPGHVTLLFLCMGAAAPIGNLLAGVVGDRWGRKRVLTAGLLVNGLSIFAFYQLEGIWVPLAFASMLLSLNIVSPLFAALGAELFSTSFRSTASGVRQVVATMGGATGLMVEGWLYGMLGSHGAAITTMLLLLPIAPLMVVLFLPETAKRELEEIAPEGAA